MATCILVSRRRVIDEDEEHQPGEWRARAALRNNSGDEERGGEQVHQVAKMRSSGNGNFVPNFQSREGWLYMLPHTIPNGARYEQR